VPKQSCISDGLCLRLPRFARNDKKEFALADLGAGHVILHAVGNAAAVVLALWPDSVHHGVGLSYHPGSHVPAPWHI